MSWVGWVYLHMLTVKELSAWLNIKDSTLYLWVSKNKIPCRRIHGLVRFEPEAIQAWLKSFETSPGKPFSLQTRHDTRDLDHLIEASKARSILPATGNHSVKPHPEGGCRWGCLDVTKHGG